MVDEFKNIRDNLFKAITGLASSGFEDDSDQDESASRSSDAKAAKALLQAIFTRAGKGKDEIVQTIAREIGMAVAAMLKEPLSQLAKHQKLQISFELVPKTNSKKRNQAHHDDDNIDEQASNESRESDSRIGSKRHVKKHPKSSRKPRKYQDIES